MATINQPASGARPLATPRQSLWQRIERNRIIFLYLFPALAVMTVMTLYPIAFQVYMSFTDYGLIRGEGKQTINRYGPNGQAPPNYRPEQWVGLDNYTNILQNKVSAQLPNFNFLRTVGFNLWWTFSNVLFHVALGIVIAVILNTKGLWFRPIYRAIYIIPMVLPALVIATVWRNMFDQQYGAVNQALKIMGGLINLPPSTFDIRWLQQIENPIALIPLPLSYYAMLIANIYLGWPFMTIIATGALQSIPAELYEAASMDGATGFQQFRKITLPMLRPAMVPAAMVGMIMTFNLFHVIYFISGGGPLGKTEILVTQAFKLMNEQQLYGVAAAFCVFIFIILATISLITNKISRATESYDV